MYLFDYEHPANTDPEDNTEIRQVLLYYSQYDVVEFKKLSKKAMIAYYGKEAAEKGNLSDMLLHFLRLNFKDAPEPTMEVTVDQAAEAVHPPHVDEEVIEQPVIENDFKADDLPVECQRCSYPLCSCNKEICDVTGEPVIPATEVTPFDNPNIQNLKDIIYGNKIPVPAEPAEEEPDIYDAVAEYRKNHPELKIKDGKTNRKKADDRPAGGSTQNLLFDF